MPDLEAQLAAKELQLVELRALFLNAIDRLGAVTSAIGIPGDEPAEKLRAQATSMRARHRAIYTAADQLCDCAHPLPNGHYSILPEYLTHLQQTLDHHRKPAPTPPKQRTY